MKSRTPTVLIIILTILTLGGAFIHVKERVARYNFWVSQDKEDSKYLNEEIGRTKEGKVITRKTLLDYMILKEIENLKKLRQQPQAVENGR